MKHMLTLLLAFFGWSVITDAQFDNVLERAKRKTEQRVNRKIDQGIDKGLDGVEDPIKGKGKDKDGKEEEGKGGDGAAKAPAAKDGSDTKDAAIAVWTERYDFQPGAEIIFFDDLEGEKAGEIPGK